MALLYPLYIGNLDTCEYADVPLNLMELTPDGSYSLTMPFARPYHTEVQMVRSMIGLLRNIRREATIQDTRQAVKQFQSLVDSLEYRFESIYDYEITDPKTTYSLCWSRLIVRDCEPLTVFKPAISLLQTKIER